MLCLQKRSWLRVVWDYTNERFLVWNQWESCSRASLCPSNGAINDFSLFCMWWIMSKVEMISDRRMWDVSGAMTHIWVTLCQYQALICVNISEQSQLPGTISSQLSIACSLRDRGMPRCYSFDCAQPWPWHWWHHIRPGSHDNLFVETSQQPHTVSYGSYQLQCSGFWCQLSTSQLFYPPTNRFLESKLGPWWQQ